MSALQVPRSSLAHVLMSAQAVRRGSSVIMALAQAGQARHFTWHPERMALVSAYVSNVIRQRYPGLDVPYHSRWRHFESGGVDRWAGVASEHGLNVPSARLERARARVDLAFTCMLLDAGAGPSWHYTDQPGAQRLTRSEGLSVAGLRWWSSGALSSDPHQPGRVDACGLERVLTADLGLAFQVSENNPLVDLEGRANRLRQLALAIKRCPDVYERPDSPGLLRPGHLVDALFRMAPIGQVRAVQILALLLHTLGHVWPGRHELEGMPLGDCWPHPDGPDGWLSFHQFAQSLTYSLLEPLEDAGLKVIGLDELTGLPDCRNGGLLLDLGLLQARDRAFHTTRWTVDAEPIVEWRALTVAILDHLAEAVRSELALTPAQLPMVRLLEGGSWAAGRQIAQAKRPGGSPPLHLDSDGAACG